jgi:hypothetical protein
MRESRLFTQDPALRPTSASTKDPGFRLGACESGEGLAR